MELERRLLHAAVVSELERRDNMSRRANRSASAANPSADAAPTDGAASWDDAAPWGGACSSSNGTSDTWAYFNGWDSDSVNKKHSVYIIVPTTRPLDQEEEKKLVAYFNDTGPKRLPSGLPYVDNGTGKCCLALTAEATKEMEKLAAKGSIDTLEDDNSGANSRCMYVKRMKVTGKEEIKELCAGAYQKLAEVGTE